MYLGMTQCKQTLELTLKEQVRAVLLRHYGHEDAITGQKMADILGFKNDRIIRLVIRELIKEGLPIAASGKGYFITETWAERQAYLDDLKSRLIQDALRRRDYKLCSARYLESVKQGRLI